MIVAHEAAAVRKIMQEAGFTNVSDSENVVFFGHPDNPHRVDFLKIDSDTMAELMESAERFDYAGYRLMVPGIGDLIKMKLFSLAQGSTRREAKDMPDVVNLFFEGGFDLEYLRDLCGKYAND